MHTSWEEFVAVRGPGRILGFSSHGDESYTRIDYRPDDALVFGGETTGLPEQLRAELAPLYRIPMSGERVRSLNLANAVAVVLYEALRQLGRA